MTRPYSPASVHTGQSDPTISRSAPKHSNATSRQEWIGSGVHVFQSASVTRPDSFAITFGHAESERRSRAHSVNAPRRMSGLAR
jgi:hypothetical protein